MEPKKDENGAESHSEDSLKGTEERGQEFPKKLLFEETPIQQIIIDDESGFKDEKVKK